MSDSATKRRRRESNRCTRCGFNPPEPPHATCPDCRTEVHLRDGYVYVRPPGVARGCQYTRAQAMAILGREA